MRNRKKILIVNLAGMGDIILSSPAVKNLKEQFPNDDIFFLTFSDNLACVECCPYVTGVFGLDKRLSAQNIKTLFRLRQNRFDQAVNFYNIHTWRGAFKMWLVFSLIAARETFGRNTRGRGFFYRYQLKESGFFERHDSLVMSDVAGLMGAKKEPHDFELWIKNDGSRLNAYLLENNVLPQDNIICIHPGAARLSHRWPLRQFALVAEYLAKKYQAKIIVTGSPKDHPLAARLQKLTAMPLVNACGRFSLSDLTACLKRCRLLVTNDTGPMHIASLAGTAMVVMSGNSPQAFLPLQTRHTVFLRKELSKKPNHFASLKRISCFEVFEAADLLLKENNTMRIPPQKNSGPVKVLHLHTRAIVGGSSANVLLSIEGLSGDKFTGHFACGKKEAQDVFLNQVTERKIPFHFIGHLQNKIHLIDDLLALFEIIALIRKEKYHIVHTHNSKAGVLGRIAAKICNVGLVVHTIHSCEFNYEGTGFIKRRIFVWAEKLAAFLTDRFIAISEHIKKEFLKHRIAPENRITVIYSGIELERFHTETDRNFKRKELGLSDDDVVVGVVSRLERGKGHDALLRAIPHVLEKNRNAKFLFVGDGPLRYELENFVKNANINGHIILTGLRSDIPEILQSVDVFCSASFYEGMGRAVLEAQAAGRPVVANRSGGIPDIVLDGKTAILAEPDNDQSLSEALIKLTENKKLRQEMGREAAQFVDGRFSAEKMAGDIGRLYERYLYPL